MALDHILSVLKLIILLVEKINILLNLKLNILKNWIDMKKSGV